MKKSRFSDKRPLITALLLCALPQILKIVLNCIYSYEIDGNIAYGGGVNALFIYGAEMLGYISFFSAFGIAVYLTSVHGLKRGGEWVIGLIAAYGISYLLLAAAKSYLFGMIAYLICSCATVVAFLLWIKGARTVYVTVLSALFLSVVGGLLTVVSTEAVSLTKLLYYCFYGLANYGFELLLVLCACRLCSLLNERMGGKYISGKLISFKNPCLTSLFVFDVIFTLIIAVEPTVGAIGWLMEYGAPVNSTDWLAFVYTYGRLAVILTVGYLIMRISAGITERALEK